MVDQVEEEEEERRRKKKEGDYILGSPKDGRVLKGIHGLQF